jgi:prephenate dehydrogenase
VVFGNLEQVATADVVIPTVPISAFRATVRQLAPLLKKHCLFIDVCSVKMFPVAVMEEVLPPSVSILATHPMFGPDSYHKNGGLTGLKIVLHPVRIATDQYQRIKDLCQAVGLKVQELDPTTHDRLAVHSQLYSFLIGRLSGMMGIKPTPVDTYWSHFFVEHSQMVENDGSQLFRDMIQYNQFAQPFLQTFRLTVDHLLHHISGKDHLKNE